MLQIYNWTLDDWQPLWNCANCHEFTWHNGTIPLNGGDIHDFMQYQEDENGNPYGDVNFKVADFNCQSNDQIIFDYIGVTATYPIS
jgi:hypothetical protein